MRKMLLALACLVLLPWSGWAQTTQQPPPSAGVGGGTIPGVACDGVTQTAAAIQAALDTAPAGTKLLLPPGTCLLNQTLTMARFNMALQGTGVNGTVLKQTVANIPVIRITVANVDIADFSVVHSVNPTTGGDGVIARAADGSGIQQVNITNIHAHHNYRGFVLGCVAYAIARSAWATFNNSHGFEFVYDAAPGCGVDQWDIISATSQLNLGAGFYGNNTAQPIGIGPWIMQSLSFGNMQGGFVFKGTAGNALNDLRLHENLSSSDNVAGMLLNTYGNAHMISNFWVEYVGTLAGFPVGFAETASVASNTGHGLEIGPNNGFVSLLGGTYWNSAWSGVSIDAPYVSFVGGTSYGNGLAMDPLLSRRAGVHIGGDGVVISGHAFLYANAPATLHYIHLQGSAPNVVVGHNAYAPGLSAGARISTSESTGFPGPALMAGGRAAPAAPQKRPARSGKRPVQQPPRPPR